MSFIEGILSALGIGGGSLNHIKAMAHSAKPGEMEHMAGLFDQGSQVFNQGHSQLESAIDNVVTGWRGEAATAASTRVLDSAMTSRTSAEASSTAAENVRQFVADVREAQAKIAAVQPVDTSFSTAMHRAGGPAALVLNPGAVAANMAAAGIKAEQHREQAAGYLDQLNASGERFAARQSHVYPALARTDGNSYSNMPARLSIQPISSGGGGSAMPGVPSSPGGPSGPTWHQPGTPGNTPTFQPGHGPKGNPGPPTITPDPGPPNVPGPVNEPPAPGTSTTLQGTGASGSGPGSAPVALPDPVGGSGGTGIGAGTVALVGGGAAAIAAGGLSGLTRGGAAAAGGARAGAPGAVGEDGVGERGFARGGGFGAGSGSGGAGDEALNGRLRGGLGSGAGFDGADEAQLRASRMSAAAASELAAGERGAMMPGMGAGAGRRSDDEELEKRPDYLVETDDVWGDGRLAAPPVLG